METARQGLVLIALPIAAVLVVHAAGWWLGGRVLGRRSSVLLDPFERQLCGLALLAVAAMVLATIHWLRPPLLIAGSVVLAALGLVDLAGASRLRLRWPRLPTEWRYLPTWIAVALFLALGSRALVPQFHHDDLTYHLLLPQLYLDAGGWVVRPDLLYANMPHLIEMLYCWPLALGGLTAVPLFVVTVSGMVGVRLWRLVSARAGTLAAGVLILAVVSGRNVQWHLGPAHVEPVQAAYLLAAVLIASGLAGRDRTPALEGWLLGLLLGFVVASKYTTWPFAALVALFAVAVRFGASGAREAGRFVVGVGTLGASFLAPWLLKSAWLTGNPIYPNLFSLLGGAEWSEAQALQLHRAMEFWNGGSDPTLLDRLAVLWRLPLTDNLYGCPSFSIALMALFLLSVPVLLAAPESDDVSLRLARRWFLLTVGGLMAWGAGYMSGRFLMPWIPVIALSTVPLLTRLRARRWGLPSALVLVLAAGGYQWLNQAPQPPIDLPSLSETEESLLARNSTRALAARLEAIMPPDGRLLSLWENRWLFLDRDVVTDSVYEAPRGLARLREQDDAERFAKGLAGRGITHVVIHAPQMQRYLERHYEWEIVDPEIYPLEQLRRDEGLLQDFVGSELNLVEQFGPWGIFALRRAS